MAPPALRLCVMTGPAKRSRHLLAVRFYQERILSPGKAARMAGMDRWQFIDLLSENQAPVIDYSDDELAAEFAAVKRLADDLRP